MDVDASVSRPSSPYPMVHSVLLSSTAPIYSEPPNTTQASWPVHFTVYASAYTHAPESIQFKEDQKLGLDIIYEVLDVSEDKDQYDWREIPRRKKVKLAPTKKRKAVEAIEECEAIARLHPQQRWDHY